MQQIFKTTLFSHQNYRFKSSDIEPSEKTGKTGSRTSDFLRFYAIRDEKFERIRFEIE